MTVHIDPHSRTWAALEEHIDARMAEHIQRLQGDVPWDEVIQCRARLKELRLIKSLVVVDIPVIDEDFDLPA